MILGLTGCDKEITISELDSLRDEITTKVQETDVINNFASVRVDYDKNVVIVELIDNSKEKQKEFKDNVMKSKYIEFQQGGPYTTSTSGLEFYIKTQDREITLKTYLSTANQTIDDGIKSITDELELKDSLKDWGTKIYKSKDKDITMIVCNTTKGDKNVLIGDYSLEYTEGYCKN